jgi:hypothetical protein
MRGLVLAVLVLEACGGRSQLSLGDGRTDAGDTRPADAAFADQAEGGGSSCETPEGVRICGGKSHCPWLRPPECPGEGCTPTGAGANAGVCWSDLSDKGDRRCAACNDGEVCAFRQSGELVCVPPDLCELLWDAGDLTGCRYADKSDYTNALLPTPSGPCPGALDGTLCGGDCGPCPGDRICVGRSPGRPFGVCALTEVGSSTPATCSAAPPYATCNVAGPASCAVFHVPARDQSQAEQYALCMYVSECRQASTVIPGGLACD